MPEYSNSKIYKIISPSTDKIYIGSTTQPLLKRLQDHIIEYKSYNNDNTKDYSGAFIILAYGDYEIVLMEQLNLNNISELLKKKGEYIKANNNICLNISMTGLTKTEYILKNREHILEHKKQFRIDNKESIAVYRKQYYVSNKDTLIEKTKQYYITNKESIAEKKKQYRINNKEALAIKSSIYRDIKQYKAIRERELVRLFKYLPFYNNY